LGNVHQCHRWIDAQGSTHESVQVTDRLGVVTNEHYIRDIFGRIFKVESDPIPDPNLGESVNYVTPVAVENAVVYSNLRSN